METKQSTKIVLCDTDVLIELLEHKNQLILDALADVNILISIITRTELLRGAFNKQHFNSLQKVLSKFSTIPIDTNVSMLYSNLFDTYTLTHRCEVADTLIASTAIYYNIELFTLNKKHFKYFKGLKLFQH